MPPAPARPAALAPPPRPSAVGAGRRDDEQRTADECAAPSEMLRSAVVALDFDVAVDIFGDHGDRDVVERAARLRGHDSVEVADRPGAIAVGGDGQGDLGVVSHRLQLLL